MDIGIDYGDGQDKTTTNCVWCKQIGIPVEQRANARGYGYYGICPKCKKETVVEEIDFTRN